MKKERIMERSAQKPAETLSDEDLKTVVGGTSVQEINRVMKERVRAAQAALQANN
jgi:bacteriocin-like protein